MVDPLPAGTESVGSEALLWRCSVGPTPLAELPALTRAEDAEQGKTERSRISQERLASATQPGDETLFRAVYQTQADSSARSAELSFLLADILPLVELTVR